MSTNNTDTIDAVRKWELYECSKCGHIVLACSTPEPIRWTDGHVCTFVVSEQSTETSEGNQ